MQMQSSNVCQTPGCVHAASEMLKSLDKSVDPCDDFYNFTCGKFLQNTKIPGERANVDSFSIVNEKLKEQIFNIITEDSKEDEPKPFTLAKKYFQSCMNKTIIEERGLTPLKELIDSFGGWPVVLGDKWDAQESIWDWKDDIKKFRKEGMEFEHIFSLGVPSTAENSSVRGLQVSRRSYNLTITWV